MRSFHLENLETVHIILTMSTTSAQELHLVGSLAAPIVNDLSPVVVKHGPKGSLVSITSR